MRYNHHPQKSNSRKSRNSSNTFNLSLYHFQSSWNSTKSRKSRNSRNLRNSRTSRKSNNPSNTFNLSLYHFQSSWNSRNTFTLSLYLLHQITFTHTLTHPRLDPSQNPVEPDGIYSARQLTTVRCHKLTVSPQQISIIFFMLYPRISDRLKVLGL